MTLQVASAGAGPDLALIHGWGLGAGVWDGVVEALAASCRVHVISLPGYDAQEVNDLDFSATATALADKLPVGCTLCGWSLGGMLALAAAAARPQHIGRLVLVSTTPRFMQDAGWPDAQPPALLDTFSKAVADDAKATLTRFIMLFNQGDEHARAITRSLSPLLARPLPDTATLLRGLSWLGSADLRDALNNITQPTLVIHGDKDPLMPIGAAESLATRLPHAQLTRVAGVAHAPFVAAPDAFVSAVSAFCHAAP